MQQLAILGATGTIGRNTIDVAVRHPEKFNILAVSANRDVEGLFALCNEFYPAFAAMADNAAATDLRMRIKAAGLNVEVLAGVGGINQIVALAEVDQVVAGIVGAAGLLPVLEAIKHDKRVLLANKEPLVMAGALVMSALKDSNAELIPLDSEHNAVFQCLPGGYRCGEPCIGVRRITLTASGGPFRTVELATLETVTPDEAVAHPNWTMGRKISVDSATMMNKGLEKIEASWLFDTPADNIDIVLHPQSLVHSFVEYEDGSVLAQLGQPDMRTPIAQALGYPDRIVSGVSSLNLQQLGQLEFEEVDLIRYPCLKLANIAAESGGHTPNVLNAANEIAVEAFLEGRITYPGIYTVISATLEKMSKSQVMSGSFQELEVVLEVDKLARNQATEAIASDFKACH